jgi:hypothetical protein
VRLREPSIEERQGKIAEDLSADMRESLRVCSAA